MSSARSTLYMYVQISIHMNACMEQEYLNCTSSLQGLQLTCLLALDDMSAILKS